MKVNAVIEMADDKKSYIVSFSNGEVVKVKTIDEAINLKNKKKEV